MSDGIVFRMSKKAFWVATIISIILSFVLIGIPMLIAGILRYKFTSITISKAGLVYRSGVFTKHEKTIPYEKINSIEVKTFEPYNLWKYGTVTILTGNDSIGLRFSGLDDPLKFKKLVEDLL